MWSAAAAGRPRNVSSPARTAHTQARLDVLAISVRRRPGSGRRPRCGSSPIVRRLRCRSGRGQSQSASAALRRRFGVWPRLPEGRKHEQRGVSGNADPGDRNPLDGRILAAVHDVATEFLAEIAEAGRGLRVVALQRDRGHDHTRQRQDAMSRKENRVANGRESRHGRLHPVLSLKASRDKHAFSRWLRRQTANWETASPQRSCTPAHFFRVP